MTRLGNNAFGEGSFGEEAVEAIVVQPKRTRRVWLLVLVLVFSLIPLAAIAGFVYKWQQYRKGAARLQGRWAVSVRPLVDKAIKETQKKNGDVADRMAEGFSKMVLNATSGATMDFQPDGRFECRLRALLFFGETKTGTWRVVSASGDKLTVIFSEDETGNNYRFLIEFQDDDHALLTTDGEAGELDTNSMTRVVEKTRDPATSPQP